MQISSAALDQLFSETYEELRRLAASVRRGDPSETITPTVLVNEAYLKLIRSRRIQAESRLHFLRIAARAMRQVLVEAARRRNAVKRGGSEVYVTLNEDVAGAWDRPEEMLALDAALEKLAGIEPRQATMIEYRFFGGYGIPETARLLEVSESTVERDWRLARAWIARELRRENTPPRPS
jgi:RNA polymerase sigma factor (TIGR02999 family)